ncbi:MAG: hypothetical protein LUG99_09210 [Lachnospiraceae bacterium]|nr:hypothetical protein [Lachnospiraceae bacterium]
MGNNHQNPNEGFMDWDDAIENDGQEFVILEEGDYNFEVVDYERGRFPGGKKIPACNKVTFTLQVRTDKGVANCFTDLIWYRSMEWKIASFFRCIGQKKKDQRLVIDWNDIIGRKGRAHFKPATYEKDGEERSKNDVTRFYDYDEKFFPAEDEFMDIPDDLELPFE